MLNLLRSGALGGSRRAAPVPVSATDVDGQSFAVTFDRNVSVPTTAGWTFEQPAGSPVAILSVASVVGAVVTFNTDVFFLGGGDGVCSYSGSGTTAGSPDGVHVAAITNLTVTDIG